MPEVFAVQGLVLTAASLFMFVIEGWAFVDAISHRPDAFVAADKMTKKAWLVILGLALGVHILVWQPLFLLNIIGIVAALVYVVDARPALHAVSPRRR